MTSQGVVAHRHRFINWNIGAITNLAPEHIESHGSFENYRAAKLSFLRYVLKKGGMVFLNRDDEHFGFFKEALPGEKTLTYGKDDEWIKQYLPQAEPDALAPGRPHEEIFDERFQSKKMSRSPSRWRGRSVFPGRTIAERS